MRLLRTSGLLLALLLSTNLAASASVPTVGKGMWIWQIWNEENGNLDSVITRLKTAGVTWVAVKLGDSNSQWNAPGQHLYNWAATYGGFDSVIARFHENGIRVYGWQYVYGVSKWTGSTTLATEADVTNAILDIPGIDGFIIDAEVEFQASGMTTVAAAYMDSLRAAHPNSYIAVTSFARVTGHPLPWTTFLASCDANMPQAYWALRPSSISKEFTAMRSDFESWEQRWINEGYLNAIKPIVPIGCENPQGETNYQMHYGDLQQFATLCQNAGYLGISLWDYVGMTAMNWSDYAASWANIPPKVPQVTVLMPTAASGVPTYDSIKVDLNAPMDLASMQKAFSFSPPVSGKFFMNPDLNRWTFAPDTFLTWSTQYTIRVDTSAVSVVGVHLKSPYSFAFTTVARDTTPPFPLAISPGNGGTAVSHAYFEFIMNKPVDYNSFVQHLLFVDSTGKRISLAKDMFQLTPNDWTLAAFRSALALTPGMKYTASIGPGVADYYGNQTKTTYSTTFMVDTSEATGGTVVEDFESPSTEWTVAPIGQGTSGVDTSLTAFSIQSVKKYDGSYAGQLQYAFDTTSANDICEVESASGVDLSASYSVGMWVFGDNSGNELDFAFGTSGEKVVPVDTINWYGWKFISMWRAGSDTSTATFKGFAVRRLSSAILTRSSIYVDDIQINGEVTGVQSRSAEPISYQLMQNYPNPFNPTTNISYRLSAAGRVTLTIYDVLGRKVATLVNARQNPGSYTVTFNASRLSSGVYFYRLDAGVYTATKKMLLIK